MNTNRFRNIIGPSTLAVVVLGLVYLFVVNRNNLLKENTDFKVKYDSLRFSTEVLKNLVLNYGEVVDLDFKRNINVIDSNNDNKTIQEIIGSKKVVFRFDETNCFSCVETFFPFLNLLSQKLGKNNIIIIGAFYRQNDLFLKIERFHLNIPVYNIKPYLLPKLNAKVSFANAPYIFCIDSTMKISNFFFPEKGLSDLSKSYCDQLEKRF